MPASSRHLDHISRWLWIFLTWHNLPVLKAANLHRPWLLLSKFCFLPSNSNTTYRSPPFVIAFETTPLLSFLLEHLPQPATYHLYSWKHYLVLLLVSLKILNLSIVVFPTITPALNHCNMATPPTESPLSPHCYNPHVSGHVSRHSLTPPLP